jgi:hypothetical protein
MAFIPIPDGALAVIEYGTDVLQWTNTLTFTKPGFDGSDLGAMAQEVRDWAELNILSELASQYKVRQVTAYDMRTVTGPKFVLAGTTATGQRVGDTAALNVALVVTFYTNTRGRSGRGRNYVTGFIEDDVTNVSVNATPVGDGIENAYGVLDNLLSAIGWTWVIAQRFENGAPLATAVTREVLEATVRSTIFGTQRRRVERP